MASADLLLHPVRLRILKAFLGDRALTTSQLAAELNDVPAGSLYRHVALLTKAGVLQVVAERRVRGAVERTYTLRLLAAQVGLAEAAAMTPDEHAQAFLAYVAGLLADFDRYLAAGTPNLARDGVLQAAWAAELGRKGTVSSVGTPVSEPAGPGVVVVKVPVTCERGALTLVVSVHESGLLTGLQLAPPSAAEPTAPWEPPAYAD